MPQAVGGLPTVRDIPHVVLNPLGMSYVSRRNPWLGVFWSVALPGFGHLRMGQHLKGMVLMSWEIVVNNLAHLNVAIYYTFLGDIDRAKAVLDYRWAILYPVFYLFTMYDAYRICVEMNELYEQERVQRTRRFDRVSASIMGMNQLVRRKPALAAAWSAIGTGFGQLYCDRGLKALILMGWYFAVIIKSGLSLAFMHTLLGEFDRLMAVIDWQWLMFWPSIYIFGIADAFHDCVEQNIVAEEAFRYRMRHYLRNFGPKPKKKGTPKRSPAT